MERDPQSISDAEMQAQTAAPPPGAAVRPRPEAPPRRVHPADVPVPERGVTWRAILIGTLLIPINTYWIIQVEGIWHTNHATGMSLFWNSVFCIFLLVLLNLVFKRYVPR